MAFDFSGGVGTAVRRATANPVVGSTTYNRNLLGQAQQAGFLDPFGSPRLRALRRKRALQLADIQRRRAGTYGQLIGLDPMSQRAALSQADIGANAGLAGGLLGADVEEQQRNLDFFRQLYGGELDFQRQAQLQRQAERAASRAATGQAIGSLGGAALRFIPGL